MRSILYIYTACIQTFKVDHVFPDFGIYMYGSTLLYEHFSGVRIIPE